MNLKKQFLNWKITNNLHGPSALNKFIMTKFIENLSNETAPGKYVFKGGNLLWFYIKTPRPTVDIDFSSDRLFSQEEIEDDFKKVKIDGCLLTMLECKQKVTKENTTGFSIQFEFLTDFGSQNRFSIDIVSSIETNSKTIKILNSDIVAASMENIILDKLHACARYGAGNTRMKDYDDLFRIAVFGVDVNFSLLTALATIREIKLKIDPSFSDALYSRWKDYRNRKDYRQARELPAEISHVIDIINEFLIKNT